ncbi:MAG: ribosomal RNA small subunit methyltransferase A [Candidatus Omnitrophica bacterium]|nr:ribosomal RNA small subunit methyltransferase A [Candidatus Omnitrophota bacterium]
MLTQIELIRKYGLSIRGHLGQHLLIDGNISRKIVDALNPAAGDEVLEIGPGLGALTGELLNRGSRLTVVEKDARFAEILNREYASAMNPHFKVVHQDFMDFDLKSLGKKQDVKVISNLPYYITAPILMRLLEHRGLFSKAVVMMQKEVAQRFTAMPGSKDYGRLSLKMRYYAGITHLFDVKPTCFTPRPKVHSSVLELQFRKRDELPKDINEEFLFDLIKLAFSQRRKTFLNLLIRDKTLQIDKQKITEFFESNGMSLKVRGEELLMKDFIRLAQQFQNRID